MGLKEKLTAEIKSYGQENNFSVTDIHFLYAGPQMRTRHTLILAFTDAGLFTFNFKLAEAEMYYLAKEFVQKIELTKKKLVYILKITAVIDGKIDEGKYVVSKHVLGRKWHNETIKQLLSLNDKYLF